MKKILILMIAVMAMGVQTVSAQVAKVMLQHNGKATLFETTELQKAIDASVDGDTIYVGAGKYNSSAVVTISKKISVVGQGTESELGAITISLPGGSEMSSTILYGVNTGAVTINSSVTNLHIDKCTMSSLDIKPQSTTSTKTYTMKDMVIERCNVSGSIVLTVSDAFENAIIRNCSINRFSNNSTDVSFINCTMNSTTTSYGSYNNSSGYVMGNYLNSIIKGWKYNTGNGYSNSGTIYQDASTNFVNCQIPDKSVSGTYTDCYVDTKTNYTDEELQVKGYLGTDDTVIGCNGGARPYNLVPAVPSLEDIKLDVNYNTKKLNVTVKVKAN